MYTALILYGIFFTIFTTWAMNVMIKTFNTKIPKEDLLTEEEVRERLNEKFPVWYKFYFPAYVFLMIGTAVILVFMSNLFISKFPVWVLSDINYLILATNPLALFTVLSVFFPGIVIGSYLMRPIEKIFPNLEKYGEMLQIKQFGLRTKGGAKSVARLFARFGIVTSIISIILVGLAANNYYYIENQNFHYNPFLGFKEVVIPLDNLEKVEVSGFASEGRRKSFNWEYILIFNTGQKFDMKEAGPINVKRLDTILIERHVPLEIIELSPSAIAWLYNNPSKELFELFKQIIGENR
jgi:hypothetical protein